MSSSREPDHRAVIKRRQQRAGKSSNTPQEDQETSVSGTSSALRVDPVVDAGESLSNVVHVHTPSYPFSGSPTHLHTAGSSSGSIARGAEGDREAQPPNVLAALDVHRVIGRAFAPGGGRSLPLSSAS